MRIQFACLLLVLLSATVLSQDKNTIARYKKFRIQHINETMSVSKCDDSMQAKINNKQNTCKKKNTFILADIRTVRSICVDKGEPCGKMTKSRQHFDIVVCEMTKKQGRPPNCPYHGEKLKRKIIIKCQQGYPVHYDRDIGHCEN